MEHYVCRGGCDGVSSEPGTCQAENCPSYQKSLEKCECQDGTHAPKKAGEETKHD